MNSSEWAVRKRYSLKHRATFSVVSHLRFEGGSTGGDLNLLSVTSLPGILKIDHYTSLNVVSDVGIRVDRMQHLHRQTAPFIPITNISPSVESKCKIAINSST